MHRRIGTARLAGRSITVGLAAALALTGCSPTPQSTAPTAAPSSPGTVPTATARPTASAGVSPDFDGDGAADLVVGTGERAGRVAVRYANGRSADIRREDVEAGQPGSADFGQALLARDLDADGFTDLVVADPSVELGLSIFWIYGTASGLDVAGRVVTTVDGVPGAGRALALVTAPGPVLVVGGGSSALLTYQLGADGRPAGEPQPLTPESLGLPALAPGSRFGSSLAASGALLAIGAPGADVGAARRAGAVYTVDYGRQPLRATRVTQDSPGVPDNAQSGDRFGTAVAIGNGFVVVGVPGEDREDESGRRQAQTGAVQPFRIEGADLQPEPIVDQADLPGNVEAGDGFGSAVSVLRPCRNTVGMLVGASAEAIGRNDQAGSIWLVPIGDNVECGPVQLYDGEGLGEEAAPNTLVGSAVSVLRQKVGGDTLVVVAQGTAEEGVDGRVLLLDHPYDEEPVEAVAGIRVAEERSVVVSPPEG